jgi:hypothetical protein
MIESIFGCVRGNSLILTSLLVCRALLVSVRFSDHGWDWSGGFAPDQLGDTQVKVRNHSSGATQMLRVEVSTMTPSDTSSNKVVTWARVLSCSPTMRRGLCHTALTTSPWRWVYDLEFLAIFSLLVDFSQQPLQWTWHHHID